MRLSAGICCESGLLILEVKNLSIGEYWSNIQKGLHCVVYHNMWTKDLCPCVAYCACAIAFYSKYVTSYETVE